jgi:hypothetical protein
MNKLKVIGNFIAVAGELLGLVLSILFVYQMTGTAGMVLGIVFFPFTWAYIPLYKLFVSHRWDLVFTNYGSLVIALLLYAIADIRRPQPRSVTAEPPTQPVMTKTFKDYIGPVLVLLVIGGVILATLILFLN